MNRRQQDEEEAAIERRRAAQEALDKAKSAPGDSAPSVELTPSEKAARIKELEHLLASTRYDDKWNALYDEWFILTDRANSPEHKRAQREQEVLDRLRKETFEAAGVGRDFCDDPYRDRRGW